jgi:hypothetical protein
MYRLLQRITATVFALLVGLSMSFAAALDDPESERELIEEAKVVDVRCEARAHEPKRTESQIVVHTHVFSSGDHIALPHRPLPSGHCLVNGLRAPLRC